MVRCGECGQHFWHDIGATPLVKCEYGDVAMLFGKDIFTGSGGQIYASGDPLREVGQELRRYAYRHNGNLLLSCRSDRIYMGAVFQRKLRLEAHNDVNVIDCLLSCVLECNLADDRHVILLHCKINDRKIAQAKLYVFCHRVSVYIRFSIESAIYKNL